MMDHASFERLCDLADDLLPAEEVADVQSHLDSCVTCQDTLAGLRGLLARASSLSSEVEPPGDAWRAIRNRLAHPSRAHERRWWLAESWATRAAAAVLLVAASSMLTVLTLRQRDSTSCASDPTAAAATTVATPAVLRAVDDSYAGVVEELTTTLRAQRGSLAPATVATLERTLRIIDEAIAEARMALAADPGNGALLDVLSGNYEQKVQLLRRASELAART